MNVITDLPIPTTKFFTTTMAFLKDVKMPGSLVAFRKSSNPKIEAPNASNADPNSDSLGINPKRFVSIPLLPFPRSGPVFRLPDVFLFFSSLFSNESPA